MRFRSPLLLLLLALPLVAQQALPGGANVLHGRILDSTGAAVPGATVSNAGTGTTVVSGPTGDFALLLPGGTATVTIVAMGFERLTETVSPASADAPREFKLRVAALQDSVTVTEPADYRVETLRSSMKAAIPLRNVPQSVSVVTSELIHDQMMTNMSEVVQYMPGISAHQGENNRDQVIIRGNSSSADFFLNGVRDDVQYYRDLYNLERVEALKGPNAMIFGRGGGGGVINRVIKTAEFIPVRSFDLDAGSFGFKRFAADFDQPLGSKLAFRLNAMYEDAGSFRRFVDLNRYGVNPTFTIKANDNTRVMFNYEHLHDRRVADRGITSFNNRPANVDISTFYGNPDDSHVGADVDLGTATIDHRVGQFDVRNRTQFASYDRGYQNYVPGAASADATLVAISAYNNTTNRLNVFNQTDLTYRFATRGIRHTLVFGSELGRQRSNNFRNTGYFNNTATSLQLPFDNPLTTTPVTFRQSATDADNRVVSNIQAGFVQDIVELSRYLQLVGGVRIERFDLHYLNNRNDERLGRTDTLLSPRVGVVLKPRQDTSVYANYSVSHLPSAGDQFAALTSITRQLKPEDFHNYELGVKWDAAARLSVTAAVYRLDRTNTRSADPNDATRIIQTGSQRSNGFELGLDGHITSKWQVAGGYAWQDAFVTSATASALAGAQVAQVPHHSFSLWNRYQVARKLGAGIGLLSRSAMFAAINNTVVLPGHARVDGALYYSLTEKVRLQVNVENMFDRRYIENADNNNNISPGSPRALRIGLTGRF